jgi:hypothetical protein
MRIRCGERRWIRSDTEQRILNVGRFDRANGNLVNAAGTWRLIDRLIEEGYTKKQLALWAGWKRGQIQLRRNGKIRVRNARRIERLYTQIEVGQFRRVA